MKNLNAVALYTYIPGIMAVITGMYVLIKFDTSEGLVLLISIGSMFGGILLVGIAEIIRLLSKISRQIDETK
ncbi:hypothetical protein RYX56_06310 [Alkalihalophilus lindianensis]|uniref:Uncharacterized protein n=1 Tax=Alkalihalophilus lindianensis TaxID=1630542 RepID=A0ABU3X942_9BACI|nr:hypothetical protein [Alkalihalophilus lindianensis]MDV2683984.1 hypothetical protein [Alkalihalophilus lindianensis]